MLDGDGDDDALDRQNDFTSLSLMMILLRRPSYGVLSVTHVRSSRLSIHDGYLSWKSLVMLDANPPELLYILTGCG
jgi:hypothetical protein